MNEKRRFYVFLYYIKQNISVILFFVACAGIFALVFSLYDLPSESVFYASALCLLLAAIVIPVRFYIYYKRHRENLSVLKNVSLLLEHLSEPRTLEEADMLEMLRSLKKELESAVDTMNAGRLESMDFYTTWVHQIKTPIAVMRMILEGEDTDEHRELLAELFRIEQYAEMALNYLRLGSDSSDYVFREYDIDGIIRQAIHKYAPLFVRRKIRLIYEPVHENVLTDEKWLLFIIEQILSNSAKYTYEGNVSIVFTPQKLLKISDTGIGIAPEDLPRIFEKGFTGYNGRSDKKSTGLGLYLCRTAADRLGHKIFAESAIGKGTTVFIDLRSKDLFIE